MKVLTTLTILLLSITQSLWSQGYTIENYDIKIEISKDGYFDVNEKISVNFYEERRGIMKNVPREIIVEDKVKKIKLSRINVANYESTTYTEGNDYIIRIGNKDKYITGDHTYDISYRISNAFLFYEDHIAFQYNLITDGDTEVNKMSYEIILPDDLDFAQTDHLMMTGINGAINQHVSIKQKANKIIGRSLLPIKAKENATIALRFPYDYISRPVPPIPFYKRDKLWFLPLGALFLFINFFRRSRKSTININSSASIEDEHFPPSEFSPAMVGAYYDNKVNTEDVIALLPYWAEKGYIKILKDDDELYFNKLRNLDHDAPEYQLLIFDNLFGNDDMILLSELKEKMYMHLYKAKKTLHKQLLGKNLYDDNYLRIFRSAWMIPLGILLILSAIAIAIAFQYILTAVGIFILAIATFVMYAKEPKKSDLGIKIHRHLVGLKQFLQNSPEEVTQKLLNEYPQYFEHIYPYAIALGIDKTWLKHMKEYDINAPHWYGYYGNNNYSNSSPSFNDFSKDFSIPEIKSVFTSAPASRSGSGGSGGGFSGGGAGGGFGGGVSSW